MLIKVKENEDQLSHCKHHLFHTATPSSVGAGRPRGLSFFYKQTHQAALEVCGNPAKATIANYTFKRMSAWCCTPWHVLIIKEEMALLNVSHIFSGCTITLLLQLLLLLGHI